MDKCLLSAEDLPPFDSTYNNSEEFNVFTHEMNNEEPEPLTTKKAVNFLLEGTLKYKVCRFCLNIDSPLTELDEIFEVAQKGAILKVTLRDMIASVHPVKIIADPNFPDKVCRKCVDSAISSYFFAQQCEKSERALRNCFSDMYDKFEKLDPLERVKRKGRQKKNPNYNILYTEHKTVEDYAEPIISIVNLGATTFNDTQISDLECPKCWQVFTDVESLINHENMHPNTMWYNCRLCGQSFVKRYHYKKHVRDIHVQGNNYIIPDTENTKFKCNECGFVNDSFGEHLQHVEKHKFKTTMEHVLNRNMDKLCAVCFEKGTCMVQFNEPIYLHGGYPELNDERTIYSIVNSTLPERKSYKYQELLIPTRANIMTVTKRMDSRQWRNITTTNHNTNIEKMFHFSSPMINSVVNTELEMVHIFIFSEPHQLCVPGFNSFIDRPVNLNDDSDSDEPAVINKQLNAIDFNAKELNVATNSELNLRDVRKDLEALDDNVCNESNNGDYCEGVGNLNKDSNVYVSCKMCWIFKKANCPNCLSSDNCGKDITERDTTLIEYDGDKEIKVDTKECSYCWLFANVGKCGYCNKATKSYIKTKIADEISNNPVQSYIVGQTGLDTFISNKVVPTESDDRGLKSKDDSPYAGLHTRKRKSNELCEIIRTPKSQWRCHICLTDNDKTRQTCYCCDFDSRLLRSTVKFNFGSIKTNLFLMSGLDERDTLPIGKEVLTVSSLAVDTKDIKETAKFIDGSANVVPMDFEISSIQNEQRNKSDEIKKFGPVVKDESMDIAYGDTNERFATLNLSVYKPLSETIRNNQLTFAVYNENADRGLHSNTFKTWSSPSIFNVPTVSNVIDNKTTDSNVRSGPFQFNIGSNHGNGKNKSRRIMKPLRRMATMGRK